MATNPLALPDPKHTQIVDSYDPNSLVGTKKDATVAGQLGGKALFGTDAQGNRIIRTNIPGAAGYLAAANLAKLAYGNALARINQGRSDTLRTFGYAGDIDPTTGVLKNMRVDPTNPYGNYQNMLKQGAQASSQAYAAAVGRNVGVGGGLAGQLQYDTKMGFGQASSDLGRQLSSTLFGYQDQQTQAKYEQNQALFNAEKQALQEAIQARMFNLQNGAG